MNLGRIGCCCCRRKGVTMTAIVPDCPRTPGLDFVGELDEVPELRV
jgi:hypothetical protein